MKNRYSDRELFVANQRNLEKIDKDIKDMRKQQLIPTIPSYDSEKFPPDRVAGRTTHPPADTDTPAELGYDANYYPNRATYGQIVRDTNDYDSLWMYQDDDKWHQLGVCRARLEMTQAHAPVLLNWTGGVGGFPTEPLIPFDYVDNPYPSVFASSMGADGIGRLFIQVGGVYSVTYRIYFVAQGGTGGGFYDIIPVQGQVWECDWDGFSGYTTYIHSAQDGINNTVIFPVADDVLEMWPGGDNFGSVWPPGQPIYVGVSLTDYHDDGKIQVGGKGSGLSYSGCYLEVTRLGGGNRKELTGQDGLVRGVPIT